MDRTACEVDEQSTFFNTDNSPACRPDGIAYAKWKPVGEIDIFCFIVKAFEANAKALGRVAEDRDGISCL